MKQIIKLGMASTLVLFMSACHNNNVSPAKNMTVSFADKEWNEKMIPKDQVCKWALGEGSTPKLNISV